MTSPPAPLISWMSDYRLRQQLLPKSNVLEFQLDEGVKVIVRPSGTEPKIKAYLFSRGETREESQALNDKLAEVAKTQLLA